MSQRQLNDVKGSACRSCLKAVLVHHPAACSLVKSRPVKSHQVLLVVVHHELAHLVQWSMVHGVSQPLALISQGFIASFTTTFSFTPFSFVVSTFT